MGSGKPIGAREFAVCWCGDRSVPQERLPGWLTAQSQRSRPG
uniref:Uncharacterized protein n=1 Tax=Desertifilum tharense IPPAS B-1220 TaxID=1781255 RepID=A0ACD5GRI3_9CYAN